VNAYALANDADKWLAHLQEMNVRWIVRSPNYPQLLAPAFSALEEEGELVPIASTNVENLTGTGRIYGKLSGHSSYLTGSSQITIPLPEWP
jgi:hypothetical protein